MSPLATPHRPTARANAHDRHLPRGALLAMGRAGIDVAAAARAAGVDAARLDGDEVALTGAELAAILADGMVQTGDPALGLCIGMAIQAELMGVVGLALTTAATFGGAIARCARYKRLLTSSRVWLEAEPSRVTLRVEVSGPEAASRLLADVELAFFCAFGRCMTNEQVRPCRAEIRGQRPPHAARYEKTFLCPVSFGAAVDGLVYPIADLEARILGANAELHTAVSELAERRMRERNDRLIVRVRAAIEALLPEGAPRLGEVARRLATSARTMQRGLRDEGVAFSDLVDDVRREVALLHVRDERFTASEIAYLTGFSHPNSFYRAFRRWTQASPAAIRRGGSPPKSAR